MTFAFANPCWADRYAILVGVEDYQADSLSNPRLAYPVEDVTELAELLRPAGYRVTLLTDQTGKKDRSLVPSRRNIDAKVREVLRNCRKGDTVLVGLAGHGVEFAGKAYFCPEDARPYADETATLVSIDDIYKEMEKCFAGAKVMLVDACRNDPDPSRGRSAGVTADSAPPPRGVGVLFSCSSGQRAFEHDDLKHGVFFHYVLDSLRSAEGKELTLFDVYQHVARNVTTRVPALIPGVQQSPNLRADLFGLPPVLLPENAVTAISRVEQTDAVSSAREGARPRAGQERSDNGLGMKFCYCPAGSFLMGSPDSDPNAGDDEKPQHRVELTRGVWMGKYEVTQGEWERVMGTTPWKGKRFVIEDPRAAASNVSWEEAVAFCDRLTQLERAAGRLKAEESYRLPTEAQWEYACRAGTKTRWSFGDEESRLGDYAWFGDNPFADEEKKYTHRVGEKRGNNWGLHDVHGNLWEWCRDLFDENDYDTSPVRDPTGPSIGKARVLRGGSWNDWSANTRSGNRGWITPPHGVTGFRVSRTP